METLNQGNITQVDTIIFQEAICAVYYLILTYMYNGNYYTVNTVERQ